MNKNNEQNWDGKVTIITKEGKKIRRAIRHVGQGIDSHIIYKGKRCEIESVSGEYIVDSVWKIVDSK